MTQWLRRLRARIRYRQFDRDLSAELGFHREMKERALASDGVAPDEAKWRATREMGNMTATREQARAVWIAPWLESIWQDLHYAVRHMRRNAATTATAILIVGLGVGLATAVYSVASSVLLRALPFAHPDRLVTVFKTVQGVDFVPLSGLDLCALKERTASFEDVAGVEREWFDMLGPGLAEYVDAYAVTGNLFTMLGIEPIAGRTFRPDEDQAGRNHVVVLDEGFWRRAFGGDPRAIGTRVRLAASGTRDSDTYEIVGVVSSRFHLFYRLPLRVDVYVPRVLSPADRGESGRAMFFAFGRLRRGVAVAGAQAEVRSLVATIGREHPKTSIPGASARVTGLQEELVGQTRPAFLLLAGAALVVLLIACANVANLLLSDGLKRSHELSVRLSLGCSRRRLGRQLSTEHMVLAVSGGLLGMLLACWATPVIVRLAPAALPRVEDISVDFGACVAAFGVSLACGLAFGALPAWVLTRHAGSAVPGRDAVPATAGPPRRLLRSSLVVLETTLVVVLLAAAGLIVNGLWRLAHLDLGFDARNVFTLDLNVPDEANARSAAVERELVSRVRTLPGVTATAATSNLPFSNGALTPVSYSPGSKAYVPAAVSAVDDGYFGLLKIALREGRLFGTGDLGAGAVAIVNEAMARRFPGGRALGQHILAESKQWREIVGVVADITEVGQIRGQIIKLPGFTRLTLPAVYVPSGTSLDPSRYLLVRSTDPVATLETAVRRELRAVDPNLTVRRAGMLSDHVRRVAIDKRFYALIIAVFAAVALVLSALGVYAVLANGVAERTREIGVRTALGATPASITRWFALQASVLVAAGLAMGLATAAAGTRVLRGFLFEVSPTDPATLALVAAVVVVAASAAAYVPLRRATRTDACEALRHV